MRRAGGKDERFRDFESTRKSLDDLEAVEGDQSTTLLKEIQVLKDAGFRNVSVFWQEYRRAVYGVVN